MTKREPTTMSDRHSDIHSFVDRDTWANISHLSDFKHNRTQTTHSSQANRPFFPRFVPALPLHRANPAPDDSATTIPARFRAASTLAPLESAIFRSVTGISHAAQ